MKVKAKTLIKPPALVASTAAWIEAYSSSFVWLMIGMTMLPATASRQGTKSTGPLMLSPCVPATVFSAVVGPLALPQ